MGALGALIGRLSAVLIILLITLCNGSIDVLDGGPKFRTPHNATLEYYLFNDEDPSRLCKTVWLVSILIILFVFVYIVDLIFN